MEQDFRCGLVAIVGRPNVGKSTLINALVGYKVSIVAPKAQTTRHRIMGILTRETGQIIFVDTPGLHSTKGRALNKHLNRIAQNTLTDAHVIVFVSEATQWRDEDTRILENIQSTRLPCILLLNKIDQVRDKKRLLPCLAELQERHNFEAIIPVSALKKQALDVLENTIIKLLPRGEPEFENDDITDRSERFLIAELIREQIVLQLRDELPYETAVEVEEYHTEENNRLRVMAVIWVARESQKAIVIGQKATQLKQIGIQARANIEKQFGVQLYLKLRVAVREQWANDPRMLQRWGYME